MIVPMFSLIPAAFLWRHKVESGGRPLVLLDLLVEAGSWVSTSWLRESSSSCSCSRVSRVCVMSFASQFLCDCCLFDLLPLWRLCFFLFLCLMSSFLFRMFFLMHCKKQTNKCKIAFFVKKCKKCKTDHFKMFLNSSVGRLKPPLKVIGSN